MLKGAVKQHRNNRCFYVWHHPKNIFAILYNSISTVFDLEVVSEGLRGTVLFPCKTTIFPKSQFFYQLITSYILRFQRDCTNYLLSSWISNYFPKESKTLLAFLAESCHFGLYVLRISLSYSSRLIVFRISNPSS